MTALASMAQGGFGVVRAGARVAFTGATAAILSARARGLRRQGGRARDRARTLRDGCRAVLRHHGIEAAVEGLPPSGPSLLACNHVSWLDPIVVAASAACAPISKLDVRSWPVVGSLAGQLGVIFYDRGNHRSGREVLRAAERALLDRVALLNFPEGTTTDGTGVAPFHKGLFGLALRLGVPVIPVALRYQPADLAWTGDATFVPHYLRLAARGRSRVLLRFGEPIDAGRPGLRRRAGRGRARAGAEPAGGGVSQQSAAEYLSHGQAPFFRLPQAVRPGQPPDGTRAVLLGVPYDGGTTAAPGARFAPYHVRRVSAFVQGWHPVHHLQVFERVVDGGNVVFPPFQPAAVRERIEADALAVHRAGAAPFLVGGDHSIALPALRAAARVHGPLAVVHVDAHLDTSGPETWSEPFHHGTPFRHAIEEGLILPSQLHQVGLRGPWGAADDGRIGAEHGASITTADEVAALGPVRRRRPHPRRGRRQAGLRLLRRRRRRSGLRARHRHAGARRPVVSRGAPADPRPGRDPAGGHGSGGGLPGARPRRPHLPPGGAPALRGAGAAGGLRPGLKARPTSAAACRTMAGRADHHLPGAPPRRRGRRLRGAVRRR